MTTRELRLFVLLLVVALLALVDLGWNFVVNSNAVSTDPNRPTPERAKAAVNAILPRIENDPSGFRALFATARLPIQRDIVTRYEDPASRATLEVKLPVVAYTGYLALADGDHAVINGTGYGLGDTVAETGERIAAISADAVELFTPQTNARRIVPFTEELPAAYAVPRENSGSPRSPAAARPSAPTELESEPLVQARTRPGELGVVPEIREDVLASPAAHALRSNRRFDKAAAAVRQ